MIFWGETEKGEKILLGEPESVTLKRDADAPADLITASFPAYDIWESFLYLHAYENGNQVFSGIVDEQRTSIGKNSMTAMLVARSKMALLLDNEAMPQTLMNPSLRLISKLYIEPFGFAPVVGSSTSVKGAFTIFKGESCWSVLDRFCRLFHGSKAFCGNDGLIYAYEPEGESLKLKA